MAESLKKKSNLIPSGVGVPSFTHYAEQCLTILIFRTRAIAHLSLNVSVFTRLTLSAPLSSVAGL
ncbi:hypothetical protein, partial [Enterococcus cecorum]|uniref:hypothetical protein n=1 Tax=Enterococcus cecorum TaxID=44008 RepID=UPI001FABE92C